jgi:hypothetical protein
MRSGYFAALAADRRSVGRAPPRYCLAVQAASIRRIWLVCALVLVAGVLSFVSARAATRYYHDDSVWANALRSLGGVDVPYDFGVFLHAGDEVRAGRNPYPPPATIAHGSLGAPYAYPPVLAVAVVPLAALPERAVHNTYVPGVLFSLLLIAATVGGLLLLDVRDWRCYPFALVSPITVEPVEYGAVGPLLFLLVAVAWRFRDRAAVAAPASGAAAVLKLFLAPLLLWLVFTRRTRAALLGALVALSLALVSWAAIGFRGLEGYPRLLRRLAHVEAESSYSAFAVLRALGFHDHVAQALTLVAGVALLALAWGAARTVRLSRLEQDRRSLILVLAAALVLTPILWLHYLVLLLVPIALARPRLSLLWLAPLAFAVFEELDWYRGWPNGDGRALGSVAVVSAIVIAASLRSPDAPRGRALEAVGES